MVVSGDAVATAPTEKRTYAAVMKQAAMLEVESRHAEAAVLYDEAKLLARATKRSQGDAVTAAMRCRQAAADVAAHDAAVDEDLVKTSFPSTPEAKSPKPRPAKKAAGLAKVAAILDEGQKVHEQLKAAAAADMKAAIEASPDDLAQTNDEETTMQAATETKPKKSAKAKPKKVVATNTPAIEAHNENLAKLEIRRAKQNGLKVGTTVEHSVRGKVTASCKYEGVRDWRYRGKKFTSISAAANAAAEHLGLKSRELNGWIFWGVEKREES